METHREYFNRLAPEWNNIMPDDPANKDLLNQFGIEPGDRILDIGTGTGKMAAHLSVLAGPAGCVFAQDIAVDMVFHGRNLQKQENILWLCENAETLSYRDETFDKILCFSAFPHFQDKGAVLREMYRVLKPGGRLLILHISSSEELNDFHRNLDGPVSGDILPPSPVLGERLRLCGFTPENISETDELYWVSGRKPAN